MKLKDILNHPYPKIMVCTTLPDGFEGDALFGYCAWDDDTEVYEGMYDWDLQDY